MTFSRWLPLICCVVLVACQPPPVGLEAEDERNSFFKQANELVRSGDFYGAIQQYEKALQANPKVARAHYEIGMIYGDKLGDHVASIYHFQRYLNNRPTAANAAHVKTLIEKARIDFLLTLPNSGMVNAEEIARISRENVELKQMLARSLAELEQLKKAAPFTETAPGAQVIPPLVVAAEPVEPMVVEPPVEVTERSPAPVPVAEPEPPAPAVASRTHTVVAGETLWRIASKNYPQDVNGGVQKILAANPVLKGDVKNLKAGQVLTLP
jgi:LysM repeat protein